jgi:pyrroline-5-carboxylate reductase
MKILIIGAGNMGLTFGASFINASVIHAEDLYFMDRLPDKAKGIQGLSAHPLMTAPCAQVAEMDLVILGVKPQDFPALAEVLRGYLRPDQLLLSIMAGISVASIQAALGIQKVVRAMPNLPAQVGQGMTVFTTSEQVRRIESHTVQNLLSTTGQTLFADKEEMINPATAISGSGPAYVFYFMNAMMDAAQAMGFSRAEAQLLVRQTFRGGLNLLDRDHLSCQDWIKRVSSKGGTTEAAIHRFDQDELASKIQRGLEAARKRAVELSGG